MRDVRNGSAQCEPVSLSVDGAFRYIRKYAEAVQEMRQEIAREQGTLYRIYAVDGRTLTSEEAAACDRKEARSCMDVLHRAKLLVQATEELIRLRCLVSAAVGKAGITYSTAMEPPRTDAGYADCLDERIVNRMTELSLHDTVAVRHFSETAVHMSPSDKKKTYRYPVIRTSRLLVDRAYAAQMAARIRKNSREYAAGVQERMEQIRIEYTPRYDIYTDWHSWEAEDPVPDPPSGEGRN